MRDDDREEMEEVDEELHEVLAESPPAPEYPDAIEGVSEFTGEGGEAISVPWYSCPVCGRNGQDQGLIEQHIKTHEPDELGGES